MISGCTLLHLFLRRTSSTLFAPESQASQHRTGACRMLAACHSSLGHCSNCSRPARMNLNNRFNRLTPGSPPFPQSNKIRTDYSLTRDLQAAAASCNPSFIPSHQTYPMPCHPGCRSPPLIPSHLILSYLFLGNYGRRHKR